MYKRGVIDVEIKITYPKKDAELTLDNAELALQLLSAGTTSDKIDVYSIACKALNYYIKNEEPYQRGWRNGE